MTGDFPDMSKSSGKRQYNDGESAADRRSGKAFEEVIGEVVLSAEESKVDAGNLEKRIDIIFDFLKEAMP
jgi:hypothetical protein